MKKNILILVIGVFSQYLFSQDTLVKIILYLKNNKVNSLFFSYL
jgi:hypothetical protein